MKTLPWIAAIASMLAGLPAAAQDLDLSEPSSLLRPSFYVHAGLAGLIYSESAKMKTFGTPVEGATVSVKDAATVAFELGYFLTPNIAVSVTGGYPPLSKVVPEGTIQGIGTLGKALGGPAGVSIHYHLTNFGSFQPYIGGGVAALVIFDANDGLMRDLKVKHTVGPMVQAGFDYMIDDRWGVFFDVKKAWLETVATGQLYGVVPAKAKVKLDPLVLNTGITYRW